MKRFTLLLLAILIIFTFSACHGHFVSILPSGAAAEEAAAAFQEEALTDYIGIQSFASSYYDDTPIAVSYTGLDGYTSPVFDRETIIKVCDAIRKIYVTGEVSSEVREVDLEPDSVFTFTMSDGDEINIRFLGNNLLTYRGEYTVSGTEDLFAIAFPGYSDEYSVFDLFYDSNLTDFINSLDNDPLVSVGRQTNGGATLTSVDEDVFTDAYTLLSSAKIIGVESNPDQNLNLNLIRDYIFTTESGNTYTFRFADTCLQIAANEAYGNVYYILDNAEALHNLIILPPTSVESFNGGVITGLRSDIERASQALEGTLTDAEGNEIYLSSLYISFEIDDISSNVQLSGSDASYLLELLCSMEASEEKLPEIPEGNTITVSVSLSDSSGPIFYLCDGAIQQTIGNWYSLDEAEYSDFVDNVLSYYYAYDQESYDTDDYEGEHDYFEEW